MSLGYTEKSFVRVWVQEKQGKCSMKRRYYVCMAGKYFHILYVAESCAIMYTYENEYFYLWCTRFCFHPTDEFLSILSNFTQFSFSTLSQFYQF